MGIYDSLKKLCPINAIYIPISDYKGKNIIYASFMQQYTELKCGSGDCLFI